uniref:Poly [ADP-ribose] polymerase n=1 Tax=Crypthecodinium cohnii TaxID=2866 RepID=A0A516AGX8_CRYCO|nr:poly [ADP-ribose] polymerase 1 [Crypthecodinium cohnii]
MQPKVENINQPAKVYTGQTTSEGPVFNLIMQPKVKDINQPAKVRQGDGWPSAKLYDEPNEVNSKSIECPNETSVIVKSTWSRWAEVLHNGSRKCILLSDLSMSVGGSSAKPQEEYSAPVRITIPKGTGPGEYFEVDLCSLQQSDFGPGKPGRAPAFLGGTGAKGPATVLKAADKQGCTAIHHCISPLPFGSFENTEMLAMLIKAGVPTEAKNKAGKTALDLAKVQSSGRMLQCLKDNGAAPASAKVELSDLTGFRADWPVPMDLEKDVEEALQEAEKRKAKRKAKHEVQVPVESHFHRPSAASRVVVANGTDKKPLDTVMTKVDLKRGPVPQNVFYRMQVVHEQNQDNYFLLTRWGGIGERGQFQTTPFQTLEEASNEFLKIFKSKAGNDWYSRSTFEKKTHKYQMHEIKYETGGARDALRVQRWKRLPAKVCPQPLRRFLNAAADPRLLEHALRETNAEKPLGNLQKKPLNEARELLGRVKDLLEQKQAWNMKDHDERKPDDLQVIMDDLLSCSSRLFELMPTKNFSFSTVQPITSMQQLRQFNSKLELTDDITSAAQLLLGAQAKISKMNPVDYIYSAVRARAEMLPYDSEELHLIERYINRSGNLSCKLFTGKEAIALPERKAPKTPDEAEAQLPLWQVLESTPIYSEPTCADKEHTGQAAAAGGTWKEYEKKGDVICIRKKTSTSKAMWVKTVSNGAPMMVQLSYREQCSKVAAVYRLERRDDEGRAKGESQLLFHGSGMANALSILSNGLKIKPPTAQHAGSAFGDGIYFANCFGKSLGYSPGSNGVSFMLLCEVDMGKMLESPNNFVDTVMTARRNLAREKLGLPKDAKPEDHPPLQKAWQNLQNETRFREITDLSGTNFDSYHYCANSGSPNPEGAVVHPDGYTVPCGELLTDAGPSTGGRDEFIVFDPQRVKLRYIIEMRNQNEATVPCLKPSELEKDEDMDEEKKPDKMEVDQEADQDDDGDDDDSDDGSE